MSLSTEMFFEHHPMFLLDLQSLDILDTNAVAEEYYGYSRNELLQMNITDLGERQRKDDIISSLHTNGDATDNIWKLNKKNGAEVFVQFTYHDFNLEGKPAKLAVAHDVTDLVNLKDEAHSSFPRIQNPANSGPLAAIEWDKNLKVKNWSEKAEELFGWTELEAKSDPQFFEKLVHKDEIKAARDNIKYNLDNGNGSFKVEGKNYTKDGRVLDCEWYNSFVKDEEGELVSIYALVHDISERKNSEDLFRVLAEKSLVGVYLIQDNIFKYINPRFAKIFKYDKEEIEQNLGPLDLTHPDDREMVQSHIADRINGEMQSIEYDFRCLTRDGETIHVNVYGSRTTYRGEPAVIGTLVDVTNSKNAIDRYRASVESFEALFDSISDAIYIQKPDGRFIQVNQGAVDMYGYERKEFIGRTPEFLAAPGKVDMEKTLKYVELALEGKPQSFKWWGQRKNGEVFPKDVLLNSGTYFGEEVVIAIGRDISDTYEVQQEVKKNEELFHQLFQNSHIGIAMLDKNEEIQITNNAFEQIFGYDEEEIRGLDINKIIVPEEGIAKAEELSQKIYMGRSANLTAKRKTKEGDLIDVMIYGVPVNVDGRTIAIFGMYVDITDRKHAEEQVRRSLKEKEVLLAEIHHRVKNNLAVITGLLELQAYNTEDREAHKILKESQLRINSIALIHEKLYQSEDLSQISFDVYLKELVNVILKSIAGSSQNVEVSIDAEEVHLTINEAIPCGLILNELVTNSFKHAFKNMDKGEVKIELQECNGEVRLKVHDNGCGMPEDFDHETSNSLGITLIKTLTQQLEGRGSFRDVNRGTCFELSFGLE